MWEKTEEQVKRSEIERPVYIKLCTLKDRTRRKSKKERTREGKKAEENFS